MKVGGGQAVCDSDSHRPHQASSSRPTLGLDSGRGGVAWMSSVLRHEYWEQGLGGVSKTGRTKNEEVGTKRELETGSALCTCDNIIAMLV